MQSLLCSELLFAAYFFNINDQLNTSYSPHFLLKEKKIDTFAT